MRAVPEHHDLMPRLDWDRFVAQHWDRRPVHIRAIQPGPFLPAGALRAAARAMDIAPSSTPYAQFTVERAQHADPRPALPRRGERSLDAYARRLAVLAGGHRHALIVNRLHVLDARLWRREREWFAPLWRRAGLPSGSAITTLFHGNYEHSPIGVHKDRFATFMFVLSGRKRMRFWPQCPWREPVASVLDYAPYLPESFAVEVGPGEALYWPASYYHVGETVGTQPATSVNVGIPREEQHRRYDVDDLLAGGRPAPDTPTHLAACTTVEIDRTRTATFAESEAWREALADLRHRCRPRELARRAALLSLIRYGAGGFEPAPPPAPRAALRSGDRLWRVRGVPLLWSLAAGGSVVIGANGHASPSALDAQTLRRLLDVLVEGRGHRVSTVLALAGDAAARRAMLDTLNDWVAWRALRREGDGG